MRRQVLTATALAAAVIPLPTGAAHAATTPVKAPTVTSDAKALVKSTKALKKSAKRGQLVVLANRIRKQQTTQPCAAITTIGKYRGTLRKLPKSARKRALVVDTRALALSQRLLQSKRAKKCGGGVSPAAVTEPTPSITRDDASGVSLTVTLPEVQVGSVDKGGKLWTELGAKNAEAVQTPGQPAVPVTSFSVAVPDGATVETVATPGEEYTVSDVDLVPSQPDAVDDDTPKPNFLEGVFKDPPFTKPSADAYMADFPAKPADAAVVGEAHGLKIATLQVPLATYNGRTHKLKIRRSVNVTMNFKGGGTFGGDGGPWDKLGLSLASSVINKNTLLGQYRERIKWPLSCGEEFLIITNPSTKTAADKLAAARNAAGIKTRVFQTVAGEAGTTNAQIRDFIRGHATRLLCVRPGYVLLLGNDELVPTFEISGATSDLPYATVNDADTLPDLASGRIPGNADEVATAVDKIIGYENTPLPDNAGRRAFVAAEFQDDDNDGREDRTFSQFAETVSAGLAARGLSVTRIYNDNNPSGSPQKFNDGTNLPASLKKPTFGWNGTGANITAAWNAGAFLGIHRDHGWSDGWGTPGYTTSNVEALTNAALPVLMSINCSSGAYDRDDTSFAGRALDKAVGGAVAVFGDTEDSPSTHNSIQGLGFVDALLPSILPGEGPATAQRLGDALVHGKLRLNSLAPAPGDGNTVFEHRIWHLYGDPTMYMRGGNGFVINPAIFKVLYERLVKIGPPPEEKNPGYQVTVTGLAELNGQTVALRRGDEVVGQGLVVGGETKIPAIFGDGSVKPGELSVVIDAPSDGPAVTLPVPSTKSDSALTQTCPADTRWINEQQQRTPFTVTGQLNGAPAGSEVKVTFTAPAATPGAAAPAPYGPFVITAKTDENGRYSATYTPGPNDPTGWGAWNVKSEFAGDAAYNASSTDPCTFTVSRGNPG